MTTILDVQLMHCYFYRCVQNLIQFEIDLLAQWKQVTLSSANGTTFL